MLCEHQYVFHKIERRRRSGLSLVKMGNFTHSSFHNIPDRKQNFTKRIFTETYQYFFNKQFKKVPHIMIIDNEP